MKARDRAVDDPSAGVRQRTLTKGRPDADDDILNIQWSLYGERRGTPDGWRSILKRDNWWLVTCWLRRRRRRPVGRCPRPRRSIIREKHRLRIWRWVRLSTNISCGGSLNGPYSSLCAQAGRSHACGHTCTLHTHTHPHTIKSKNITAVTWNRHKTAPWCKLFFKDVFYAKYLIRFDP